MALIYYSIFYYLEKIIYILKEVNDIFTKFDLLHPLVENLWFGVGRFYPQFAQDNLAKVLQEINPNIFIQYYS